MFGAFMYTGQSCTACTRVFVERPVYERFLDELARGSKKLKVGNPMEDGVLVGPMASRVQFDRVAKYIDMGLREGARAVIGGAPKPGSTYIEPTILTGELRGSRIAREEVFGPVLVVQPFDSEDEAVTAANDTPYGLGGSIWTSSINRAVRVMRK